MYLVCDSGSTKADWLLYNGKDVDGPFHSIGFNPYFHTSDFVYSTLINNSELVAFSEVVDEVFFFGAGCSDEVKKETIAAGLRKFFPNAKVIVDHDLLASAYATCRSEAGIACIIGTGSNSCWFDGKKVHEKNYGLGYILGDEGSGSYFGKKLTTHFLYNLMPAEIHQDFLETYALNKNSIVDHVYKQPNPNVWLASFATFLSKHRSNEYIQKVIRTGLNEFLDLYVCNYPDYKNKMVHFVGSIAFYFEIELKEEANKKDITVGRIIKQPIQGLMDYYIELKKLG